VNDGSLSTSTGAICSARTLVLGIGNTLLRDEGAGVRVLRALGDRTDLDGLALLDGGTLSFTLLAHVEAAACLIVVDAANMAEAPGTVRSFEDQAMDTFLRGADRRRTVHELSMLDLLAVARLRDTLPARRALVCIQPAEVSWGLTLTPAIDAAVGVAADEVARIVHRWQA
jgi:hydrogenase maturation protease